MLTDEPRQNNQGFRAIHIDSNYLVTWDDTPDLPQPPKRNLTERQLLEEIANERRVNLT